MRSIEFKFATTGDYVSEGPIYPENFGALDVEYAERHVVTFLNSIFYLRYRLLSLDVLNEGECCFECMRALVTTKAREHKTMFLDKNV